VIEELATDRITDDRDDHRSFQPYDDPTAGISIFPSLFVGLRLGRKFVDSTRVMNKLHAALKAKSLEYVPTSRLLQQSMCGSKGFAQGLARHTRR
jgi:hypothetical protein